MLRRQNAALYLGDAGDQIQLVVKQQGNNGTESAEFEYAGNSLQTEDFGGHPSCTFVVQPGNHKLEVGVIFDPDATAARYDLFQVDGGGGLVPLNATVRSDQASPLIGFTINGAAEPAVAAAASLGARGAGVPPAPPAKRAAAKKPAKRATSKKRGRKTTSRSVSKKARKTTKTRKSRKSRKGKR